MLNIVIPNNNLAERQYIIYVIFSDYLGLPYRLSTDEYINAYTVKFGDKELVIKDSFFNLYPNELSYLNKNAIPDKISYLKNEFAIEKDIPILYGSDELHVYENKIVCGIDIFASSYFMLTRWEEYVNEIKDEHCRFSSNDSTAFKYGLLHRPVVNEYVEILWTLLKRLGFKGDRKNRSFELILTHDIDHLDYPRTYRIIIGDLIKRKKPKFALEHLEYFMRFRMNPYDKFDFLMSSSEKLGLKSHFYFMASDSKLPMDTSFYLKSKRFVEKLKEIKRRGHIIGFHPGYYTYDHAERWSYEKRILEEALQDKVVEGRQHFLRFAIPETFRIWNENNMEIDSTLGYAHIEGFRCGTGDIYTVFDFLERRKLQVKERPLIIMDGTLKEHYSQEQAINIIQGYISIGNKYNSTITLLFHNSTFYDRRWEGYDNVYIKALGL